MDKKQLKELIEAIGLVAETSLIFYQSVIKAGGTTEEAMRLSQAFIAAHLFRDNKKSDGDCQ